MNSPVPAVALSGLLSLMADALEPEPSAAHAAAEAVEVSHLQAADLATVLGQVVRGWLTVKEDGHGWLLIQFAPGRDPEPAPAGHTVTHAPSAADVAARAHRVHSALTHREREVLCLVASGATNCAIAQRLFISPKTASVHVSRILTKLDAATRTEAAALAHASGLVRPWGSEPARELVTA